MLKRYPATILNLSQNELIHRNPANLQVGYTAGRINSKLRLLCHRTADLAVHVNVVKEDELRAGALAGFNSVVHDTRPHFAPNVVIVLKTNEQVHNFGASDSADGLVLIRQIGGNGFGRAESRSQITANEAERLVACGRSTAVTLEECQCREHEEVEVCMLTEGGTQS
jgi:hypothetical protein